MIAAQLMPCVVSRLTESAWSALREYAYGWGTLELNRTHMVWEFLRNDDPWNPPGGRVGDRAVYTKAR